VASCHIVRTFDFTARSSLNCEAERYQISSALAVVLLQYNTPLYYTSAFLLIRTYRYQDHIIAEYVQYCTLFVVIMAPNLDANATSFVPTNTPASSTQPPPKRKRHAARTRQPHAAERQMAAAAKIAGQTATAQQTGVAQTASLPSSSTFHGSAQAFKPSGPSTPPSSLSLPPPRANSHLPAPPTGPWSTERDQWWRTTSTYEPTLTRAIGRYLTIYLLAVSHGQSRGNGASLRGPVVGRSDGVG
jgi:hypothetical protein